MDSLTASVRFSVRRSAFTLVELTIVVAIISITLAAAQPSFHRLQQQSALSAATVEYGQSLHRAQLLAEAARGDSMWGVYLTSTSSILFKGTTFVTRDTTYDELYSFAVPMIAAGTMETDFTKLSGTTTPATSTLSIAGIPTRTIVVNGRGTISF